MLLVVVACGLPECDDLCAQRAACIQDEIDEASSTWSAWTGFDDRAAYEDACTEPFYQSLDDGTPRGDLRDVCRAEQACED